MERTATEKRRIFLALASAAVLALVSAESALGALYLVFNRTTAAPGDTVRAYQVSSDGSPIQAWVSPKGILVYLVPMVSATIPGTRPAEGPPPRSRRIVLLGPLRIDGEGVFSVSFRVPRVRAGKYTTAFWCKPCDPPHGSFFTSAPRGSGWSPAPGPVLRVGRR